MNVTYIAVHTHNLGTTVLATLPAESGVPRANDQVRLIDGWDAFQVASVVLIPGKGWEVMFAMEKGMADLVRDAYAKL